MSIPRHDPRRSAGAHRARGARGPGGQRELEPRLASGLGQAEAVEVLGVLARLAEAQLSCGSPVADVVRSVLRAARGAGLAGVQVDITYTAVTVSVVRSDGVPLTALRVIRTRSGDYARLSHLHALARAAGDGRADRGEVASRLAAVLAAPPERSALVRRGAVPVLAAAVAVLAGAGPALALAAALASGVVMLVRAGCAAVSLPPFYAQAAGAAGATGVALALLALPQDMHGIGPLTPSVVVGPGIVVLLAGLSLVESGEDAIAGYYVTAGARAFETVVMTTGLVVGIGGALALAERAGTDIAFVPRAGPETAVGVVAAVVAAAAQGLSQDAGRRAAVLCGAAGGAGWLVQRTADDAGLAPLLGVGVAALVIGAVAQGSGPRHSTPPVVVSVCGIVPMLPGLAIYRGISQLVAGATGVGAGDLVSAAGTALALAAGTTLGLWVAASPSTRRWAATGARRR